jgi:tagatose-1,6-bisphosphate aldolase non-catalytic subunit AgaZ/GatZ
MFEIKCDRYILNSVGIAIKFYRSKPEFCLMSIDKLDFRIEIEEMYLNICKVQVNPGVIYGHNEILKSTNARKSSLSMLMRQNSGLDL